MGLRGRPSGWPLCAFTSTKAGRTQRFVASRLARLGRKPDLNPITLCAGCHEGVHQDRGAEREAEATGVQDLGKTFPMHLCALPAADKNTVPKP